jgi:glucose-6-phosphate isomerase
MPYSTILKQYSSWFVQLWAESLGKDKKGLTPIPAYGATDQHSQMQLFMEGTRDKYFLMIEVEKFEHDFELESNLQTESSKLFNGIKLSDLMRAEFEGTIKAMYENSIPLARISINKIDEFNLGYLIFWAQCLTVLSATLTEVDPFNQPGVEAGKKYAKIWLKETKN